jgi:hypothetical protein
MSRVDVEYLYTIAVDGICNSIKVNPVTDEKRVMLYGHKPVIVLADHIHSIAEIQERLGDLHRLPSVRMVIRHPLPGF